MYLTENTLAEWVQSQKGLLITRSIHNLNSFNFNSSSHNEIACITGYSQIIKQFFENIIDNFKTYVTLIIIETDVVQIKPNWLNHPKLKMCFTWNKPYDHPKLKCIPISLNYDRQYNEIMKWLNTERQPPITKKLLCMNCSLSTSPERVALDNYASTNWSSFCDKLGFIHPLTTYMKPSFIEGQIKIMVTNTLCYDEWSKYKFVLSPRGTGEDCHRTWEAIITGCIPIVKSSSINEIYTDLPIVVVNDWSEITEEFLNQKYDEIVEKHSRNEFNMNKLMLTYWTAQIKETMGQLTHFITYGDEKFVYAKTKLLHEAKEFGEFDVVKGYGPNDLPQNFVNKYKNYLSLKRGGGYWLWRPILIYEHFKQMNYGDVLVYLDAGSTINKNGKKRFHEYIYMLNNDPNNFGILSFQMKEHPEKIWTTRQIFDYLKIDSSSEHAESGQYLGGIFMLKKTPHSEEYVKKFTAISLTNPDLFTDKFNAINQHPDFKDNRHDQSVSSLLRKQMGTLVIPQDETWHTPFGSEESLKYPFWATRIRR